MIKLINNYYIDADTYQYFLKEKVTRIKKEDNTTYDSFNNIGSFNNIPTAIKRCLDDMLREGIVSGEIDSLTKYKSNLETIYASLNAMLNPLDIEELSKVITKWFLRLFWRVWRAL